MYTLKDLYSVLNETIEFFKKTSLILKDQSTAAMKHDLKLLEDCMKKEQAAALKLRGLDKKREDILNDLNLSGKTLNEISSTLTSEDKIIFDKITKSLDKEFLNFKSALNEAKEYIELNVYSIDKIIDRFHKSPKGKELKNHSDSFTSKKV